MPVPTRWKDFVPETETAVALDSETRTSGSSPPVYDFMIIGSGFGGSMLARRLVQAGARVLLLERGGWLRRGEENQHPVHGFYRRSSAFTTETEYSVLQRRTHVLHRWRTEREGICACVGGPSLFFGGASFRFRESDFDPGPEIVANSGARWPIDYAEMEPYYSEAEWLLGIAGEAGADPTEPRRSVPYPQAPAPLPSASRRIAEAAGRLGLHPFPIPLALNYTPHQGPVCQASILCDAYACAIGAKNDLATRILTPLVHEGLKLRCDTVVVRLVESGGRIHAVECVDRVTGEPLRFRASRVVVAAGALASPHLLLASGLQHRNPGGHTVGHYLMRHCNAFVYGVFMHPPNPENEHHKRIAIHDFYFGDPGGGAPLGTLGNIQQIMAPQTGAVLQELARTGWAGDTLENRLVQGIERLTRHLTGLQVIAEDQPRYENRVEIDVRGRDRFGLPRPVVHHQYSPRDLCARRALVNRAREILGEAGALLAFVYPVTTFSHAVGTVRMGADPGNSALDATCLFRGVENLYVVDGSFMPTSAGVNPSLTIAANALRVGSGLVRDT